MGGKNLTGRRFGRLVAIEPLEERSPNGYVMWRCKCDCGNEAIVQSRYLVSGGTKSCGCYSKEIHSKMLKTHGGTGKRLFNVYLTMKGRCTNPNAHEYENYGGRGIKVCDEWMDYEAFEKWALANGYQEDKRGKCTLDRIDVDGDYEPSNCRWVTMKTQQRNKRNNVLITHNGETHCMSEWAEIAGIKYITFVKRINAGWNMDRALMPTINR